jgi:hypothetical protein
MITCFNIYVQYLKQYIESKLLFCYSAEDTDDVINAPILSLTISPPVSDKLDPLLQLNFTHDMVGTFKSIKLEKL